MDYGYNPGMEEFAAMFLVVFLVVIFLVSAICLVLYILQSIGIMTIAGRRGLPNPWLVWIPVVGIYTTGQIADDIHAREGGRTYFRWLLLGGQLASYAISLFSTVAAVSNFMSMLEGIGGFSSGDSPYSAMTPFFMFMNAFGGVASLIGLGVFVLSIVSLSYIYRCYKPENATIFTVLSVVLPFLTPIFVFLIRNREPMWLNPPPPYYGAPGGYPGGNPYQYAPPPPPGTYAEPPYGQTPPPPYQAPPQQTPPPYTPYDGEPRQ